MAKKNKVIIPLIILILIISVAAFFAVRTQTTGFGTSLLSLTQANLDSSNPYLSGQAWVYTFRQGGLAQHAYGTVTPSNVESITHDEKPEKNFRIDTYYENQECVYPISVNYDEPKVYKLAVCEWIGVTTAWTPESYFREKLKEKCGSSKPFGIYGQYSFSTTCFSTYIAEESTVGYFGNTDIRTQMRIDVKAGDETSSISLDSEGSTQGKVGNFAYAIWQGNLDTGKSCKYTTDMPFKPIYVSGYWRTASKALYEEYKKDYDTMTVFDSGKDYVYWNGIKYYNKKTDISSFINAFNYQSSRTIVSKTFGSIDSRSSLSSAVVRDEIQDSLQYPVITMYIKAETLGIYTPTPEIKIIEGTSGCFKTGEDGTIAVTVKNTGNEYGNWNAYATCTNPFDITRRIDVSLDAGQTKTVYLPLSATAIKKTLGKCTVTFESAAGKKTITVNTCVDPHQTCTPNQMWCDSINNLDVIKKCDSAGVTVEVFKECSSNEYCDATSSPPVCKEKGTPPVELCKWWDLSCHMKNWFKGLGNYFSVLIIVLSVFVAILGGMFTNKELTENKLGNKKTNKLVGLLFGLGLGFLFYYYILAVVILMVFYAIYRVVFK